MQNHLLTDGLLRLPSPLHSRAARASRTNAWVDWGPYTVAGAYDAPEAEAMALRYGAGIADLTPTLKIHVQGPDATGFLDRLMTRQIDKLRPGWMTVSPLCDGRGRLIGVAQIRRLTQDEYFVSTDTDLMAWFEDAASAFDVTLADITRRFAVLGLLGPKASHVLAACGLEKMSALKPGRMAHVKDRGVLLQVTRLGVWGSIFGLPDIFEIWVMPDTAELVWDRLMRAALDAPTHTLVPVGLDALERARIGLGRPRLGVDFDSALSGAPRTRCMSPYDLGWESLVDLDKPHFCGRSALAARAAGGGAARLIRLDLAGPVETGAAVFRNGERAGLITSRARCPLTGEIRVLARLDRPQEEEGVWLVEGLASFEDGEHVPARVLSPNETALAEPEPADAGLSPVADEAEQEPPEPVPDPENGDGDPVLAIPVRNGAKKPGKSPLGRMSSDGLRPRLRKIR